MIQGILYRVDGTNGTLVDATDPQAYDFSAAGANSNNGGPYGTSDKSDIGDFGTFDLVTIASEAGVPIDGTWYLHYKFVSNIRASTTTLQAPFKMDITPPTSVQNVQMQLTPGGPVVASSGGSTPTSSQKAVITWTAGEQDVLGLANSGVAYYQVLVDGAPYDGGSSAGRVFSASWLPHPSTITLDSMPPGRHAVTVVAVDRATNQSAPSDPVDFISDPDTPDHHLH